MNPTTLILILIFVLVIPIIGVIWLSSRVANSLEIIPLEDDWVRCEMQVTYPEKQARYGEQISIIFYDQAGEIVHRLDLDRWGIGRIEGLKRQLSLDGWQTLSDETQPIESGEQWHAVYQRPEASV